MVACPVCGQDVPWVTIEQAAQILEVSRPRVGQLIKAGRLPGSQKHRPGSGISALWKIPIDSLLALHTMRRQDQGLIPK